MKVRPRYLVIRLECETAIQRHILIKAIRNAARSFGEDYYEKVGPWLTYFENNYGVVKFNHKMKEEMLALLKRVDITITEESGVKATPLGISGTINKARKKYIP
jgi:RNase P/RNase MRP subunit POP5